jgi:hypothetical protein
MPVKVKIGLHWLCKAKEQVITTHTFLLHNLRINTPNMDTIFFPKGYCPKTEKFSEKNSKILQQGQLTPKWAQNWGVQIAPPPPFFGFWARGISVLTDYTPPLTTVMLMLCSSAVLRYYEGWCLCPCSLSIQKL